MEELLTKYLNNKITDFTILDVLRNDFEFMLAVLKKRKSADEFKNRSYSLKCDSEFIKRAKDIFQNDQIEYLNFVN